MGPPGRAEEDARSAAPQDDRRCPARRTNMRHRGIVEHYLGGGEVCAAYVMGMNHESLREEGADLQIFFLAQYHQLLAEVHCDHPHYNDGMHLDGGVSNNAM